MTDEWADADDPMLRDLFRYQLRAHVRYQDGRDSLAPALVFADADYEVGDGNCGLHSDGKQANEPAIVYVRADALIDAIAAKATTEVCDCQSYNQPEKTGVVPEVILDPRPLFDFTTKTVCVDACIADQIMALWLAGIFTRGCCCGHNRDFPNVFLHDPTDAVDACRILSNDSRQWRVMFYTRNTLDQPKEGEDNDG